MRPSGAGGRSVLHGLWCLATRGHRRQRIDRRSRTRRERDPRRAHRADADDGTIHAAVDATDAAGAAEGDDPPTTGGTLPAVEGDEGWVGDDLIWAATGAVAVQTDTPDGPTGDGITANLPATVAVQTDTPDGPTGDGITANLPATEAVQTDTPDGPTGDGITANLPATEAVPDVWKEQIGDDPVGLDAATATPYDLVEPGSSLGVTTTIAPVTTAEMPAFSDAGQTRPWFEFGAVSLIALLTGVVTLASLFTDIVNVTSDTRLAPSDDTPFGFRTGSWIADDLADNLSIAGLLAIILMVAGGVAAGFHWRWGAGLAGGAGLAVAGLAALTVGLAQIPIDAAHAFAAIPSEQQFTLTITRDLGYWLTVAAGALGVVLFFAAINDATADRRSGLNPWIAALGALAAVVAAGGPLLPEGQAVFSDNWYLIDGPGEAPAMLLVGRLVQLGLLVLAGVIGFLTVRRWGLGLAIGGTIPIVWLAASTLFELTDRPVGPGFRNPGAVDMHIHGVTIIGVSAIAAMSVLAVIAAYDQGVRERH